MENKRTILEYLDSLNNSKSSKKVEEKKSAPKINYPEPVIDTSKYIKISEINKLFESLTLDIRRLSDAVKEASQRNQYYIKGEINALEYCREKITNIIKSHLK